MQLRKATREKLKARVGISGSSGSGKTYSALRIAYGLCGDWDKIAIIDTEDRRGELYVGTNRAGVGIGAYNALTLDPPFDPRKYIQAITLCENEGMEVIIVDSLSHAWSGTGGLLDIKSNMGPGFDSWRKVTPMHNELVDKILRCKAHMIACVRSKTEYVVEKDEQTGKSTPRKIGLKPEFRDGLEYEMTLFLDMSQEHVATASKDNTGLFDLVPFKPTEASGKQLLAWLETGVIPQDPEGLPLAVTKPTPSPQPAPSPKPEPADDLTTEKQQRTIHIAGSGAGLTKEGFKAWLSDAYSAASTKELKQSQVLPAIEALKKLTPEQVEQYNKPEEEVAA